MNKMNVFSYGYRPRYYLTHPWKFVRETAQNFRAAWHRISRGYAYVDAWSIDTFLLEIMPPMLRQLANDEVGSCPIDMEWEDWRARLNKTADTLELLQDENWEKQNEYADEFYSLSDHFRRETRNEQGNLTITWDNDANYEEIKKKFFARAQELSVERKRLLIETWHSIGEHFDELWS